MAASCTWIKKNYMGILSIQIHLAKRFLPAKFGIKYEYMNNLKGSVYFYEKKNFYEHKKKFRWGTEWATFKLPKPFYLCFQRNAPLQFEECHIPGQNTFLNPHFYSAGDRQVTTLMLVMASSKLTVLCVEPDLELGIQEDDDPDDSVTSVFAAIKLSQ